jgi:hypothetical protein
LQNRILAAAVAALVVLCAAPADAGAQAAASTAPGAQVTGAVGFDWGATHAQIVGQRGTPALERREAEGVMAMTYPDQVVGHDVVAMFFVHPRHGLVRGGYLAPVNGAGDCAMVLRAFDNAVSRRYPELQTQERTVGSVGSDACVAAQSGRGGYMKLWTDPANGARIMLAILPGADGPMLTYTTPEADAWERRKNDARF